MRLFKWLVRVVVPSVWLWGGVLVAVPGCGGNAVENPDNEKQGGAGKGTLAAIGSSGNSGVSGSSGNPGGKSGLGVAGASSGGNGNVPIGGTGSSADYSTPEKACIATVEAVCGKYFQCFTPEQQQLISGLIGSTVAACRSMFGPMLCADNPLSCESGERYDATLAKDCIERFKAQSCASFEATDGEVEGCEDQPCVPL